jgi:ribonuclease HI
MLLYTDGSCLGNPGPGGWGAIGIVNDQVQFKLCGGDSQTTNNMMELQAVISGLEKIKGTVKVYTDSKYVHDGITKWMKNWEKNGWKTANGQPVKNQELWKKLYKLVGPFVSFEWVKAHNGDKWNENVDDLARDIANKIKNLDIQ